MVLWWLVLTVYYTLESLALMVVPRKYRRKDVQGSVALVTGGASGIGRLMCFKLAARGAIVVTWDVSEEGETKTVVSSMGYCVRKHMVLQSSHHGR